MKILYYVTVDERRLIHNRTMADYLGDSVFHGLRTLFGHDVVDSKPLWHMYKKNAFFCSSLHGRGFTLYGLLDDDKEVDRTDLEAKIKSKYFDLVVVYTHCTTADEPTNSPKNLIYKAIDELRQHYPPERIVLLDGLDQPEIRYDNALSQVTYFKRELQNDSVFPISFSIPSEKIAQHTSSAHKTQPFGTCWPGRDETYIFTDEETYYEDYRKSYFGYTMKRGGWDCMRHYEILACGAIPWFVALDQCPGPTLRSFPKELCLEARKLRGVNHCNKTIDCARFDTGRYDELANHLLDYTRLHLTTEASAKRLIDTMVALT